MKALLYNVIPLHWKGLMETIGEDEEESWWLVEVEGWWVLCCSAFAGSLCLPLYFIVNVTANHYW